MPAPVWALLGAAYPQSGLVRARPATARGASGHEQGASALLLSSTERPASASRHGASGVIVATAIAGTNAVATMMPTRATGVSARERGGWRYHLAWDGRGSPAPTRGGHWKRASSPGSERHREGFWRQAGAMTTCLTSAM